MRALLLTGFLACAPALPAAPPAPPPVTWLCRPGDATACTPSLDATALGVDDSRAVLPFAPSPAPSVDCFYVYPTVDFELVPGNHENLADVRNVLPVTLAQVARFQSTCTLWVPLYRQVTLGTWLQPKDQLEAGLAIAYADVERAFAAYLAQAAPGRRIVLIGHSQGAEMVVRLLRGFFEHDPALRSRLLLAFAIGGNVDVPRGQVMGGTFATLPLCTRPLETGCIVAYRTHLAGDESAPRFEPPSGRVTACVDPTTLDAPESLRTTFPTDGIFGTPLRGVAGIATPFVTLREAYTVRCVDGPRGYRSLAVTPRVADDGPVQLHDRRLRTWQLGLHVLDLQLPQGNLIDLVARRAR